MFPDLCIRADQRRVSGFAKLPDFGQFRGEKIAKIAGIPPQQAKIGLDGDATSEDRHNVTWLTERAPESFKLFTVFFISKPVCLFLVLLVVSTPLIACALPGEEMTKAEQDCCLQMSDECGTSQMSDSHTCCTKTPQVEGSTLKASSKYSPAAPQAAPQASLCAAAEISADRLPRPQNPCNDSPSPPGSISVLRI